MKAKFFNKGYRAGYKDGMKAGFGRGYLNGFNDGVSEMWDAIEGGENTDDAGRTEGDAQEAAAGEAEAG